MIASYETRPIARPTPKAFYSYTPSPSHHPITTHSLPTTPIASSSKTHLPTSTTKRPKPLTKKNSVSTRDKRHDVQSNLEAKVEKSKGFHAFFVPLGRGVPAAPPSSPVLAPQDGHGQVGGKDYFEDWVEDVRGGSASCGSSEADAMDLD
jgi:hypothetical protein